MRFRTSTVSAMKGLNQSVIGGLILVSMAAAAGCCRDKPYSHDIPATAPAKAECEAGLDHDFLAQMNLDMTDCQIFCCDQKCGFAYQIKSIDKKGGCWNAAGPPAHWEGAGRLTATCHCSGNCTPLAGKGDGGEAH